LYSPLLTKLACSTDPAVMTHAAGVDQAVDATPFAASDGTPTYSIKREFCGATVMITGNEAGERVCAQTCGTQSLALSSKFGLHCSALIKAPVLL
jgi:hypothetical protein